MPWTPAPKTPYQSADFLRSENRGGGASPDSRESGPWAAAPPAPSSVPFLTLGNLLCHTSRIQDGFCCAQSQFPGNLGWLLPGQCPSVLTGSPKGQPLPSAHRGTFTATEDAWKLRDVWSLLQPQRSCICVPGPFLCIGNLHSFTCGHVPAYRMPTNSRTGMQMAFGTPHMCACHFHTGASPHETTCHICGCCPALCAGRLAPMQPTAFLLELQACVGMPRSQVCVCVCA